MCIVWRADGMCMQNYGICVFGHYQCAAQYQFRFSDDELELSIVTNPKHEHKQTNRISQNKID